MHAYFINLDTARERRASVESCFRRFAPAEYSLQRIAAVGPDAVGDARAGHLTQAETGCILSHIRALRASLEHPGPALILEDDVWLGPPGFAGLTRLLNLPLGSTELIFLNLLVNNAEFIFIKQYRLYRRAVRSKDVVLLDLGDVETAGADAYIVHEAAKTKLLALLDDLERFDVPYDLLLKGWIQSGTLKAKLTLPFVTSLSVLSDHSQITRPNPDWNRYRRLFSLDSEFYLDTQISNGVPPDRAVDVFTDEHLKFLKLLLTQYSAY